MSRVYFHSPSGEAELYGSERALFGHYANTALIAGLGLDQTMIYPDDGKLREIAAVVRDRHGRPYGHDERDFGRHLAHLPTYLRVAMEDERFDLGDGGQVDVWSCGLNTLLANGSDPMVLAARLHGQCEIHAYVEGPHRAWLAGIIEVGRHSGIFRVGMGWEDVMALLRSRDDEPVVTSYSVCEWFPNQYLVGPELWKPPVPEDWPDDPDEYADEAWYALPDAERWRLCMEALRAQEGWLEMRPDFWRWPTYHFGPPITAYHVAAHAFDISTAEKTRLMP